MTIVLTDREADVMQVLWDHGPSVVADVRRRLSDKLAYATVLTVLRVLESKGYVGHEEESMEFKGVGSMGWDIYDVSFEHGSGQYRIVLSDNGIITGALFSMGP